MRIVIAGGNMEDTPFGEAVLHSRMVAMKIRKLADDISDIYTYDIGGIGLNVINLLDQHATKAAKLHPDDVVFVVVPCKRELVEEVIAAGSRMLQV